SMVPFALLSALPIPLVPRARQASLSGLNGQVWMIEAEAYHRHEPHRARAGSVLEDVEIGRLLKRAGMRIHLRDLGGEVRVEMCRSFGEAWRGFRKNAYLILGGTPWTFLPLLALYVALFVLPFAVGWPPWVTLYALKGMVDGRMRLPVWVTALTPLALLCGAFIALDSAVAHGTGRVAWKGRRVGAWPRHRTAGAVAGGRKHRRYRIEGLRPLRIQRSPEPSPHVRMQEHAPRRHPIVGINYRTRLTSYWILLFVCGSVLIERPTPWWLWAALVVSILAWPHLAFLASSRSRDAK